MRKVIMAVVACLLVGVGWAWASGEISERVEKVGGSFVAVWQVKVTEAERADTHMKLKDGSEGPTTHMDFTYTCDVLATVYGDAPAEGGASVKLRYPMVVPIVYDDQGKPSGGFTISTPGTGLESGMKKGEEYLICLGDARKAASYQMLRAEMPERKEHLVNAIGEAKCWKVLEEKHPEWKVHVRLAAYDAVLGLAVQVKGPPLDGLVLVTADGREILVGAKGLAEDTIELSMDRGAREIVVRSRDGKVGGIPMSGFEAAK